MSFSVSFTGKPEAIKRKLDEVSAGLSGLNKEEFDAIKPALQTILDQEIANGLIRLDASGHSTFGTELGVTGRVKQYGNCSVSVSPLGAVLVE